MVKIKLHDKNFAHTYNYQNGIYDVDIGYFEWCRGEESQDIAVFTDQCFREAKTSGAKIKIAWLLEPEVINPEAYKYIFNGGQDDFDWIVLPEAKYILSPKHILLSPGGCWVHPDQQFIYPKTQGISMIASSKNDTKGHKLRHRIAERFAYKIDFLCGRGYYEIEEKLEALKRYRYTIVVENDKSDHLFTEKIVDAFRTGTIPIYWGANKIADYFNKRGVLWFSNLSELERLLVNATELNYNKRQKAIRENFDKASEYTVAERKLWEKLLKDLV